jgi:predicted permease
MSETRWRRYARFWRRDVAADIDEELRFHFAARVAEYEGGGLSRDEAVAEAERQFGDRELVRAQLVDIGKRTARRADRRQQIDGLIADLRHGVRGLLRQPLLAAGIVITFALGLGVNAAMFTFLDRVYLRPPAGVVAPGEVRRFWSVQHNRTGELTTGSLRVGVDEFQTLSEAFGHRGTLALQLGQPNVRIGNGTDVVSGSIMRADANYLPLLGVRAAMGRLFDSSEASLSSPARVAVISDALWRTRYGASNAVLGKTIQLNRAAFTIIGVLQPGFVGIDLQRTDVWIPLRPEPVGFEGMAHAAGPQRHYGVIGRFDDNVSNAMLEERATEVWRRATIASLVGDSLGTVLTGPIIEALGPQKKGAESTLSVRLGGVAALVLLIACANVINLLLGRSVARRREIGVRVALGSSRARLMWLLSAPIVALALVAGIAAVGSAFVTGTLLQNYLAPDVAFAGGVMHWRVAAFTLLIAALTGLLTAVLPAVSASRTAVTSALKTGWQSGIVHRSTLRSGLVALQAGASLVLLVVAGLFVQSLLNVTSIRLGYDVSRLATASIRVDWNSSLDSSVVVRAVARIERIAGVEGVAQAGPAPLQNGNWIVPFFTATDSSRRGPDAPSVMVVSPNYFRVTGIRILRGRGFTDDGEWAIVINPALARAYWPNGDPIGQCMRLLERDARCYTIVGVSEDAHRNGVIETTPPYFFVSNAHPPAAGMRAGLMVLRADPRAMGAALEATRRILKEDFPSAIAVDVTRLTDTVAPAYRPFRLGAALFSLFGVLALVVAIVGVYSSVAYTVAQRTHEFGVCIALGAGLVRVLESVMVRGLAPVGVGIVAGVVLSIGAGRVVASLLYETPAVDGTVLVGGTLLLATTAVIAALVPARKAARVDPIIALRSE